MTISYIFLDQNGCSRKYGDTTGFYVAAKLFDGFNMTVQNVNSGGPSQQSLRWRIYPLHTFGSTNLPSILVEWTALAPVGQDWKTDREALGYSL